ncbi:hypothetical protein [Plastoroseomonas hellenica]|uniref:hypothetical protein n=1 Tax=Plastoroseomonas hellenica TaxID=2687306 RepID=UPI001BA5F4C8|nr:hypothetical protein [Plastoroseomonas hellenica]MBR0647839.1 hypothetical protein [Plastoroseomonas hellenica]
MIRAAPFVVALLASGVAGAQAPAPEPAHVSVVLNCDGLPAPLPVVFVAGEPPTALLDWQGLPVTLEGAATGVDRRMRYAARLDAGLLAITAGQDEADLQSPGAPLRYCRVQR